MKGFLLACIVVGAAALAGCGGRESPDADGDGLTDAEEEAGWAVTVDLLERRVRRHVASDPALADTDGDGLADLYERALGRDPREPDTDQDGLTDCQEDRHAVRDECEDPAFAGPFDGGLPTDGGRADSDAGISRYVNEVLAFTDETGTLGRPLAWGDGIPDGTEMGGFHVALPDGTLRLVRTDPLRQDTDGDFLEDGEEAFLFGGDPLERDSDGDGCIDGLDVEPARDLLVAPGLLAFRWNGSGEAQVRFAVAVGGVSWSVPPDPVPVQPGVERDLRDLEPAPKRAPCSFRPSDPWMPVELLAYRMDGPGAPRLLDLGSPPRVADLDPRTGALRAADASPGLGALDAPLVLAGPDGVLRMAPAALPAAPPGDDERGGPVQGT